MVGPNIKTHLSRGAYEKNVGAGRRFAVGHNIKTHLVNEVGMENSSFLPSAYLLLSAYCLLPSAFCFLPTAFCLLPTAYCGLVSSGSSLVVLRSPPSSFRVRFH